MNQHQVVTGKHRQPPGWKCTGCDEDQSARDIDPSGTSLACYPSGGVPLSRRVPLATLAPVDLCWYSKQRKVCLETLSFRPAACRAGGVFLTDGKQVSTWCKLADLSGLPLLSNWNSPAPCPRGNLPARSAAPTLLANGLPPSWGK